jgi:sulfonate transport system permease protein
MLPGSTPGFLTGLRISLTSAWLALIVAEQINAQTGLGQLMSDARTNFRTDEVVLVIVMYAVLGLCSYGFVRLLERRLLAWRQGYTGA